MEVPYLELPSREPILGVAKRKVIEEGPRSRDRSHRYCHVQRLGDCAADVHAHQPHGNCWVQRVRRCSMVAAMLARGEGPHGAAVSTRLCHITPDVAQTNHTASRLPATSATVYRCGNPNYTTPPLVRGGRRQNSLQPRVHRLALRREHAEHALVHAPERLAPHEPLEPLDAQRELAERERPLGGQPARPQALGFCHIRRETVASRPSAPSRPARA